MKPSIPSIHYHSYVGKYSKFKRDDVHPFLSYQLSAREFVYQPKNEALKLHENLCIELPKSKTETITNKKQEEDEPLQYHVCLYVYILKMPNPKSSIVVAKMQDVKINSSSHSTIDHAFAERPDLRQRIYDVVRKSSQILDFSKFMLSISHKISHGFFYIKFFLYDFKTVTHG
jgi:hypothetical protein